MKPNYGIDAPKVVRNFFLFSLCSSVVTLFSFYIQSTVWFWIVFLYSSLTSLALFITACWMLYGIKRTKPRIAQKMIRNLQLRGDEKIVDLGCGRGLVLCAIAKHLPQGEAHGVDLWSSEDQSGNCPENTLQNAEREGVRDRITLHTGDIRALPFPDQSFDAIISSLCLHNLKDRREREKALLEMLRILKPEGKFAIADIQHAKEYTNFLKLQGVHVECSLPIYAYCPPVSIVEGKKLASKEE